MIRSLWIALLLLPGPAAAAPSGQAPCSMADAAPWIERWLAAWELVSGEMLHLPDAPAPSIVLYDSACVYTTSAVTAGGAPPEDGPALRGETLPWRTVAHGDSIVLPTSSAVPVALMSFTSSSKDTGPFFVMAAPSYWKPRVGEDSTQYTGVFLHEFSHTRQLAGIAGVLGPIDSAWVGPDELNDDAVQTRFGGDSVYVAAYLEERDLLYRAAGAGSREECRELARRALAMMKARHAKYFTGDDSVYAALDNIWLSMEGVGQFTAVAWLSHPKGGGMDREAAIRKMIGRRRWWVQDEGLAVILAVDRLLPEWPALEFNVPSLGALDLLERAVGS